MATLTIPPINDLIPGQIQFVDSPWQGQGLDAWKALVRNLSPYALMVAVSTSTYWLGPFEQDYYEFPEGVYTFGIIPQIVGLSAPSSAPGAVLVTAFDQSSDYDGNFPVALSPPTLEQTFSLIGSGTIDQDTPGGLVAFGLTQQFGALLALCSWGGLDGTESTPLFMTLYTPGSFISPITMDQKGRFTEGLFNLSCAGAGDSVILQAVNGPAMFSIEYEIFGVTIADVEQLVSPPTGVSYSGDGGITIEPVVRARQGSKIAISGNVSDTTDPTITLLESDDVWYEEWVASGSADVTVATTIFDITGSGSFAFVRPAHAAWALELSSGTWNITVAVIE